MRKLPVRSLAIVSFSLWLAAIACADSRLNDRGPGGTAARVPDFSDLIDAEKSARLESGWSLNCPDADPVGELIGSLDNEHDHWIANYCKVPAPPLPQDLLVLYEQQGAKLVPLLTIESPEIGRLSLSDRLVDMEGNGTKDLVLTNWKGCNGVSCFRLQMYKVADHEVSEIPITLPVTGLGSGTSVVPVEFEDVDLDGIQEVIATDFQWELHGFCHACSPYASYVLAWDGSRYTNASREPRFRDYFEGEIGKHDLAGTSTDDELRMGNAIAVVLLYGHSGRASDGWTLLAEATQRLSSRCWIDALPLIEADLELSVPKDGREPTVGSRGSSAPWLTCSPG